MSDSLTSDRLSVAAIVTYTMLGQFAIVLIGVFALIFVGVKVEGNMLAVLGTVITAAIGLTTTAAGFWVGASVGGKDANARLAQLAGAGPTPPTNPVAGEPEAEVVP